MNSVWSRAFCDRYQIEKTDWIDQWFDHACQGYQFLGEFDQPLHPKELLEPAPSVLWPGFMLPDTLPLVGNRYGDWLCLRVGPENRVTEILHWYHGGGDYLPVGESIAEALFYDRCRALIPGHQVWAGSEGIGLDSKESIHWLSEQLGQSVDRLDEILAYFAAGDLPTGMDAFDEHRWSRAAIGRDRIEYSLNHRFRQHADPKLAIRLGVSWDYEVTKWLFDLGQIPVEYRHALRENFEVPEHAESIQRWDRAEQIAEKILQEWQDLAWASDIAGWCAFRRGDLVTAIDRWWLGIKASVFSDQSTKLKTHWFDRRFGKFSAAQLFPIQYAMDAERRMDPYWSALIAVEHGEPHQRITSHWIGRGSQADLSPSDRYDAWYKAGWDVGCQQMALFEPILENLQQSAELSQWGARSQIAAAYLAKLRRRR